MYNWYITILIIILIAHLNFPNLLVLIKKRPIIYHSKWMFIIIAFSFAPIFYLFTKALFNPPYEILFLIKTVIPLCLLTMAYFSIFKSLNGYIIKGVDEELFLKALGSVLEEYDPIFDESKRKIRLPDINSNICINIVSWDKVAQITMAPTPDKIILKMVRENLGNYFSRYGRRDTTKAPLINDIIISLLGIILILFIDNSTFGIHLGNPECRHNALKL